MEEWKVLEELLGWEMFHLGKMQSARVSRGHPATCLLASCFPLHILREGSFAPSPPSANLVLLLSHGNNKESWENSWCWALGLLDGVSESVPQPPRSLVPWTPFLSNHRFRSLGLLFRGECSILLPSSGGGGYTLLLNSVLSPLFSPPERKGVWGWKGVAQSRCLA